MPLNKTTKTSTEKTRPFSRQSSMTAFKREGNDNCTTTLFKNNSRDYLRKHKERELKK